ncbi:MAG: SMC-Scp complex subunit ScpB [Phycicoccus sp.]
MTTESVAATGGATPSTAGSTASAEDPAAQLAFDVAEFPGGIPGAVEAVLMVVDEPVTTAALATVLEQPVPDIEVALAGLEEGYAAQNRGFTLRQVGGGWRMYSRHEYAPVVERFVLDGQQARLTQAALETLAVIAYRQPVSRSRVSAVRGVNVDGVVRTLLTRGLIEEVGQDEESTATLYGTTSTFLERLGLGSLDELPALAPFLPEVDALDEIADGGHR